MTPESIGQAFAELVHDVRYREGANRLRDAYDALPPLEVAVELIERLALTKRPVVIAERRHA